MQSLIAGFLAAGAAFVTVAHLRMQIKQAEFHRIEARQHDLLRKLMKHRGGNISHPESVEALNMVPLYFKDNSDVLEAFNAFLDVVNGAKSSSLRGERFIDLCVQISKYLIDDSIAYKDIDRGYFPSIN